MNILLFSGAPNSGKTTTIRQLTEHLINARNYTLQGGDLPSEMIDFQCLLTKEDRNIIIQSYADIPRSVEELAAFIAKSPAADTLITTCRDKGDFMHDQMKNELNVLFPNSAFIEIPLGKVTRQGNRKIIALEWYESSVKNLAVHIISNPPFSL